MDFVNPRNSQFYAAVPDLFSAIYAHLRNTLP
ncbi:hypothetical protein DEV91_11746 [Phyllobacterium brassicacearum]|nr:hypothetical protein DEV91_11746 [Phyllobacterium brassicacearum]